jgi:Protein of unknown function (DUF3592)
MLHSRRIALRRVWKPAPGWPRPRRGFEPPANWTPDPSWPTPPNGWTGWRSRRGLLIAATVLGIVGILSIIATVRQAATSNDVSVLRQRGVAAVAMVTRSSYDAGGGDPDGWTSDTVRFQDSTGRTEQVVVGHHGDNHVERNTGKLNIVYDPQHPNVAMSELQLANVSPGADVAIAATLTAVCLIAATALLLPALELSNRPASQSQRRW